MRFKKNNHFDLIPIRSYIVYYKEEIGDSSQVQDVVNLVILF
jgi:hypothetical protein